MDEHGNFVVIGMVNRETAVGESKVVTQWGASLVSAESPMPPFGEQLPYEIIRDLDLSPGSADLNTVLYTLPLPLPLNNYPIIFAPEQLPNPDQIVKPSAAFHRAVPPDFRKEDGLREMEPVTLGSWIAATGQVTVQLTNSGRSARFEMEFEHLIPDSLYTVMSLRQTDLDPIRGPTRPGPLGIPNVFITDAQGRGHLWAELPDPFPPSGRPGSNRVINVILLWMSTRMSNGGALGVHGLGGDVHAQLKLTKPSFLEFNTTSD
jgi:hypothetical protein